MLATPIKLIAAKAMKLGEKENNGIFIRNCTEKNVDKAPENISRIIMYLRIEANTSKIMKRSLRVVSLTKLSTSIVGGSST